MHPITEHSIEAGSVVFAFSDISVNGLYSTGGVAAILMAGVALIRALSEMLKLVPPAVRAIRAAWNAEPPPVAPPEPPPEEPTFPPEPPLPEGPDLADLPPGAEGPDA